jgi:hypothetical protein
MNMTGPQLGQLGRVAARTIWLNEAQDFTPWLGQAENIALLGRVIGLDLEVEAQEAGVGPFRADILCKDTLTGHYVLVENQLERTDHGHLRQLITYAAGLDAVTIVRISDHFVEEHRAALDWLDRITSEAINFFGLEIELWRISDSPVAPKFNVASKPNDWQKTVATAVASAGAGQLTEIQQLHLDFWTQFRQFMEDRSSPVKIGKPSKDHWTTVAVGRAYFTLEVVNGMQGNWSRIELHIYGPLAKRYFFALRDSYKDEIEAKLGPLEWRELPNAKESQVGLIRESKPSDRTTWPELNLWMADRIERWVEVFRPIVRTLEPSATADPADESTAGGESP